ncbi:MAG: hypothetical protein CMQ61_13100 [Gammaproteobacteria bacterium]|nr:hypothetical protein [Gammaproteobacteria bacterium]
MRVPLLQVGANSPGFAIAKFKHLARLVQLPAAAVAQRLDAQVHFPSGTDYVGRITRILQGKRQLQATVFGNTETFPKMDLCSGPIWRHTMKPSL